MVGQRLLWPLLRCSLLMFVVSVVVFSLLRLVPGDPAVALYGPDAGGDELRQVRERWGLDGPLPLQYFRWLLNALSGDLGRSLTDGRPVLTVVAERLPASLLLLTAALSTAFVLGVGAGLLSGLRPGSLLDRLIMVVSALLYSTPPFWLGVLLVLLFTYWLGWLPSGGIRSAGYSPDVGDILRHLILPASALSLREAARFARLTRSAVLDALSQDYLVTAVAKGLPRRAVIGGHLLPNVLIPAIALAGIAIPGLLGGAVLVETVFAWPGIGRLAIEAVMERNYPVLMGEVMVASAVAFVAGYLADAVMAAVDPRMSRGAGR